MDYLTSTLFQAVEDCNLSLAVALVDMGADLSAFNENGLTPLMQLAYGKMPAGILALGAFQPEALLVQDKYGQSVSMILARLGKGLGHLVRRLAKLCPAILEQADKNGMTVAMHLCMIRDCESVRVLAEILPSIYDQADKNGSTVAMYMVVHGCSPKDALRIVQHAPARLDAIDSYGASLATLLAERDMLTALYHLPSINTAVLQQPVLKAMLQRIDKQLKSFQVAEVIAMGYPIPGNLEHLLKYHHDVTIEGINKHLALLGHEPI